MTLTGIVRPVTSDEHVHRPWWRATRSRFVGVLLAAAAVVLALVDLGLGSYALSIPDVVHAMFYDDGFASDLVLSWRMPRVVSALVFGAALGLAGAMFQSLTRNPLGSPDVIGFSTGSYTGALIALTVVGNTALSTSGGALIGGVGTAVVVYVVSWRRGVNGPRLIVVGIAVTALLTAVNYYLLLRVQPQVALSASIWGSGSIALVDWAALRPALIALAVAVVALVALHPQLRQLELGDDSARAHGVRAEPARVALLVVGVALTAFTTATAGPIAFVALSAPQIAHRLCRSGGLPLPQSALTGAVILIGADMLAQHVLPGGLPVGTVTIVLGGLYLLSLIVRGKR